MNLQFPKSHHYLSQFYLAGFTDNGTKEGSLICLDLKTAKCFTTTPAKVARRKHLFTHRIRNLPPDAFEKAYQSIEDQVAPVLKRIIDNKNMDYQYDLPFLIRLFVFNLLRNPHLLDDIKKDYTRYGNELSQTISAGVPVFSSIMEPLFYQLDWRLAIAIEGSGGFICSDQVISLSAFEAFPEGEELDFFSTNSLLMMPLSKNLGLIGSSGDISELERRNINLQA